MEGQLSGLERQLARKVCVAVRCAAQSTLHDVMHEWGVLLPRRPRTRIATLPVDDDTVTAAWGTGGHPIIALPVAGPRDSAGIVGRDRGTSGDAGQGGCLGGGGEAWCTAGECAPVGDALMVSAHACAQAPRVGKRRNPSHVP